MFEVIIKLIEGVVVENANYSFELSKKIPVIFLDG